MSIVICVYLGRRVWKGVWDYDEILKIFCIEVKKDVGRDVFIGVGKGEMVVLIL